jgi:hypothetical protein
MAGGYWAAPAAPAARKLLGAHGFRVARLEKFNDRVALDTKSDDK